MGISDQILIILKLVFGQVQFFTDGSPLQIVHPHILDESGTGRNLTMIPRVANIGGGDKFDTVCYHLPNDETHWTKVETNVEEMQIKPISDNGTQCKWFNF